MNFIEYYFECYFNMSANYDEIESLVEEFIEIEPKESISGFKKEIQEIISLKDWNYIVAVARIKGGRILDNEKAEKLVKYLKSLINGQAVTEKPNFYDAGKK